MPFEKSKHPWNYGLTKETDTRVAKYANKLRNVPKTEEHVAKNCASALKRWANPEYRAKMIEIRNKPELRKKRSDSAKKRCTPEWRAKKSASGKIVQNRPEVKAKKSASEKIAQNKPETKAKKSAARRGKISGEDHPNWKGGISKLPYPFDFNKELRKFIHKRDYNTCQLCGKTKEEVTYFCVHHINYDKNDLFELNLISLCNRCNAKVNYNRSVWKDYFIFRVTYGITTSKTEGRS